MNNLEKITEYSKGEITKAAIGASARAFGNSLSNKYQKISEADMKVTEKVKESYMKVVNKIREKDAKATKGIKKFISNSYENIKNKSTKFKKQGLSITLQNIREFDAKATDFSKKVLIYSVGTKKEMKKAEIIKDSMDYPKFLFSQVGVSAAITISGAVAGSGIVASIGTGLFAEVLFRNLYGLCDCFIGLNKKQKNYVPGVVGYIGASRSGVYLLGKGVYLGTKAAINAPKKIKEYIEKTGLKEIQRKRNLKVNKNVLKEMYLKQPKRFIGYVDSVKPKIQREVIGKIMAMQDKCKNDEVDAYLNEKYANLITTKGRDNLVE